MRTRSYDTVPLDNTVQYQLYNYLTAGSSSSPYGLIVKGRGRAGSMTDTVTADFKRKVARGEIINNNLINETFDVDCPPRSYSAHYRRWDTSNVLDQDIIATTSSSISGYEHLGQYLMYASTDRPGLLASIPSPSLPSADQLLVDALAKASSSDAMVLVSLAEAKKTLESVAQAAHYMYRIDNYLSKLRLKDLTPSGALRHVGVGLKIWLEVRYGLLPTYYDILGYTEVIKKRGLKSRVKFSSYASGSTTSVPVDSLDIQDFYEEARKVSRYRRQDVRAGCLVEPYATEIGAIYSLGIDRITSTAWELVPFSFVVDWFLNTSSYIAAHEGRFGQKVLASWTTVKDSLITNASMVTDGTDRIIAGKRHLGIFNRSWTVREEYTRFVRNANPAIPKLPTFQVNLNWKKCLDLVALSTSVRENLRRLRI